MFAELQFVHSLGILIHSFVRPFIGTVWTVFTSYRFSRFYLCVLKVFVSLSPMPQLLTLCRFGISWCAGLVCVCLSALSSSQIARLNVYGYNGHHSNSDFHNGGRQYKLMTNTIISVVQIDPKHPPHYVRVLSTLKLVEYFFEYHRVLCAFFSTSSSSSGMDAATVLLFFWW